jgi:hypothetical protein
MNEIPCTANPRLHVRAARSQPGLYLHGLKVGVYAMNLFNPCFLEHES